MREWASLVPPPDLKLFTDWLYRKKLSRPNYFFYGNYNVNFIIDPHKPY